MKRQRGRGRKPGGGHHQGNHHQPNRAMESNGPEVKVRGPAAVIYERYLQLARDAAGSGDRVLSENYLQHADHYFRLVRAMQPAVPAQPPADRFAGDQEYDVEDEGADVEGGEEGEAAAEAGEQQDAESGAGRQQGQGFDRAAGEGDFRRGRRGRRSRFRPEGDRDGERDERPERAERAEGEERRERRGRERDAEAGPEGFSTGPKPAFLRTE